MFSAGKPFSSNRDNRSELRKNRSFFRPWLEALEDRCLPSTANIWKASALGTWTLSSNWSLGHAPTNTEIATFDATSQAACFIDAPATASGINIASTHTGAITATANLTLGADGFVQAGGTFSAMSATITDAGDWSESSTLGFNAGTGTVDFNSPTSQTIHDVNTTFNNLTHSGTGTLNLTAGASALKLSGNFLNSSGSVDAHGTSITLTAANGSGNWTDTASVLNLGTVTFNGSVAQTLTVSSSLNNLTYAGTFTLNLMTALALTGSLTVSSGTFNAGNHDITIAANWSNSATVQNTATVTFNGGMGVTQSLNSGGSAFNNLVHFGAGTLQLSTNALTVNGTLTNTAGMFDARGLNLTVTGLTTIGGGAIQNSGASDVLFFSGGLNMMGGSLTTGLGTAFLGADVTSTNSPSILGSLNLGGPNRTVTVTSGTLSISAQISNGGLTKAGPGSLVLLHANTYSMGTFINAGILAVTVDGALGPGTGGTTVASAGILVFDNLNYSTTESVTLNGGSLAGDNLTGSGAFTSNFAGPIILNAAGSSIVTPIMSGETGTLTLSGTITAAGFDLTVSGTGNTVLNGVINGTGSATLTKQGTGSLVLNGASTYGGGTTVVAGTLIIHNDSAVGVGPLSLDGGTNIGITGATGHALANPVNLNGAVTVTLSVPSGVTLTFNGGVIGTGSLVLNGNLALTGNNSYSGGTTVNSAATLSVGSNNALGSGGLALNDGSVLIAVGGSQGFGNSVTLAGSAMVGGTNNLVISGSVSGSGSLTDSDTGTVTLGAGGATNSYSGGTNVTAGTLEISNPGTLTSPLGTGHVTLNNGTTLLLNTGLQTFNNGLTLNGTSTIEFPATLPVTGTFVTWAGLIGGTGGFTLTELGAGPPPGVLVLTANNTYSGSTTVNIGILQVSGSQPNSPITVNSGGSLFANGTVGAVTLNSGGNLAAINSSTNGPAILTTGNLQLNGGIVHFIVNALVAGTGYSQLLVNGTVSLGNGVATLQASGTLKPHYGDKVELIDNNLSRSPTSGFFAGLPEGTVENDPTFGRLLFTYQGGPTGNGMVVTAVPRFDLAGRVKETGQWSIGQSNGSAFANVFATSWSTAVTWVDVHSGDFTGNGLQDIVGRVKETGQWWMSVPNGSGGWSTSLWDTWSTGVTWVDVKVGDFNGDGKMDIVGRAQEIGQWWMAQSTGSSFTNSLWATWSAAVTWVDVQVGDFDGDGTADITGRWLEGGSWWTGISNGSAFTTTQWAQWSPNVTWVDVNVGDFNGDGKADIVGRYSQAGQWWVGISTGSLFASTLWATWSTAATWVDVKVGDFNGDGKADITGRWLEGGSWWTGISNGSVFTTSMWAQWSAAVTWVDVQVGDFNGDGKMDITARWLQGGSWWTAVSNGTSFTTTQWTQWSPAVTWVDVQDGVYV